MLAISYKELQINEEIRDPEIRVVDVDGTQLGILSSKEAQKIAIEKNLDLVKIAPQATPPYVVLWTMVNIALNKQSVKRKQKESEGC